MQQPQIFNMKYTANIVFSLLTLVPKVAKVLLRDSGNPPGWQEKWMGLPAPKQ
jgi:hypothetical protein